QGDAPFEAPVAALGVAVLVLPLALLLAGQREHALLEGEVDVLFFHAGQLGRDLDLLVVLMEVERRRGEPIGHAATATLKQVVEQPVHLPVEVGQRAESEGSAAGQGAAAPGSKK